MTPYMEMKLTAEASERGRIEAQSQLDAALAREAALRARFAEALGLLGRVSSSRNYPIGYNTKDLIDAFLSAAKDGKCDAAANMIVERDALQQRLIDAEKRAGESLFEKGARLFREGYGPSSLWGECKSDSELPEVHRGWNAAYDADALKPVEGMQS